MRQKTNIPVLTRPLDLSSVIKVVNENSQNSEFGGALVQSLDTTTGVYSPNRANEETILELEVKTTDSNTGTQRTIDWTSNANTITWSVSIDGGTPVVITTQSTGDWTLNASKQLVVKYNMPTNVSSVIIYAKGEFLDPTSGNTASVTESVSLGLVQNSMFAIRLERVIPNTTIDNVTGIDKQYVSNLSIINVPKLAVYEAGNAVPWKVDRTAEWQRKCRVQLYDGETALEDLNTDLDSNPDGVAFYYWFVLNGDGTMTALNQASQPNWLVASYEYDPVGHPASKVLWYPDGSMAKEIMVNFALLTNPVDDVKLVCRGAIIPYGTYTDYLNNDGVTLNMTKIWQAGNWREVDFHVRVKWPELSGVDMCSMSMAMIERSDVTSTTKHIKRRAMLQVKNHTLIDPAIKEQPTQASDPGYGQSVAEKLYDIKWIKVASNNAETQIDSGEWLDTTPSALGSDSLVLDVTPKTSYAAIVGNAGRALLAAQGTGLTAQGTGLTVPNS